MKKTIRFHLNEKPVEVNCPVHWTLLEMIRDRLGLTGTKGGCREGECGTCTVIVDGRNVNSCMMLAVDVAGRSVTTVEGLETNGELHPLQKAFIAKGAIQCGFCTPGMLMSAKTLLDANPRPNRSEIRKALSGNLCRCTGYEKIFEAIESVAAGETFDVDDGVWQTIQQVQKPQD